MTNSSPPSPSRLFTIRVWPRAVRTEEEALDGRLRDLASGVTLDFSGWTGLIGALASLLDVPLGQASLHEDDDEHLD